MANPPADCIFFTASGAEGPEIIFRQYELAYTGGCNKQEGEGRREKEGEWRIGEELARQQKNKKKA